MYLFLPLLMSVALASFYLLGGWEVYFPKTNVHHFGLFPIRHLPFSFLMFLLGMLVVLVILGLWRKYQPSKKWHTFLMVIFISAMIRVLFLFLVAKDVQPFSDFERSWAISGGDFVWLNHYTVFPAYINYAYVEKLFRTFIVDSYAGLLYGNAFLSALSSGVLYSIALKVFSEEKYAFLVGILYAFYPANILYTAIGTPEFLTILGNLVAVYFLIKVLKYEKGSWISLLIAGIALGVADAYKSFGPIILIAFVMVKVIQVIISRASIKQFGSLFSAVLLVLFFFLFANKAIYYMSGKYVNKTLQPANALPHFLLVGLNTEGEGQIHLGNLSRQYYLTYLKSGGDVAFAKKHAFQLLQEDWQKHSDRLGKHFIKKMAWAWQDDSRPWLYVIQQPNLLKDSAVREEVLHFTHQYLPGVLQISYWLMMVSASLAAYRQWRKKEVVMSDLFLSLIIFGYFCLMILSEAQSRYKCLIVPFLLIFATKGIQYIVEDKRGFDDEKV